jgi:uracil-DNA glycosylase
MTEQTTLPMFPSPSIEAKPSVPTSKQPLPEKEEVSGDTELYPMLDPHTAEAGLLSEPAEPSGPAEPAVKRPQLPESWLAVIEDEFHKPYMGDLKRFLLEERKNQQVFPPGQQMFNAFWLTPFDEVRVVILGQDPYHGPGQAHGLCFSVQKGVVPPPSLQNVFKELQSDVGMALPQHGDLTHWARQGVLLLNTVLSVRARQANSHRGQGWEILTDKVIEMLNSRREGLIFVLWGAAAGRKAQMIDGRRHRILRAPHPSPLSAHRGFMGCRHFSQINAHLETRQQPAVQWALPD